MNAVTRLFLRAKDWQLFLIILVILSLEIMSRSAKDPRNLVFTLGIIELPLAFFNLLWFGSVGSFLSSLLYPPRRLNHGFFRFALIYQALYFLPLMIYIIPGEVVFLSLPFGVFCSIYVVYFVSKSLILVEWGGPASFTDYAVTFFLVMLYPIGIWFIQPRINRLYAENAG